MNKNFLLFVLLFFLSTNTYSQRVNKEIVKYVDFLKNQNTSAKNYILNLWEKYDIVIICERDHPEMTQYDLFLDIIKSDYFINNVGNIFTEVGSVTVQKDVLWFTKTNFSDSISRNKYLLDIYRNIAWLGWEKSNFYFFLKNLNTLNASLKISDQVNLYVSNNEDPSKNEITSKEDYIKFQNKHKENRDSEIAKNVITVFDSIQSSNSKRKKCLVIMNYRHAFSKPIRNNFYNVNIRGVGAILFEHYGNKTANVFLNSLGQTTVIEDTSKSAQFRDYKQTPIQNGKWDASFQYLHKENLGFDFQNSPFGKDSLDIWAVSKQYTYNDIFTGFVYYLPLEKHYFANGINGYLDDGYDETLLKRWKIFLEIHGGQLNKDWKEDYIYSESKYDHLDLFKMEINKWIIF